MLIRIPLRTALTKTVAVLVLLAILISTAPHLQLVRAAERTISLVSPNGGELLLGGGDQYVEWIASEPGGYVSVLYSLDSGASYSLVECVSNPLAVGEGNASYRWQVPSVSSTLCRVRVVWISSCTGMATVYAADSSDADFSITPVQVFFSKDWDITTLFGYDFGEINLTLTTDVVELQPSASADGELVAFSRKGVRLPGGGVTGTYEIWLMDSQGATQTQVTQNGVDDVDPALYSGSTAFDWKVVFSRFDADGRYCHLYVAEMKREWNPVLGTFRFFIQETQLTSGNHQDREPCFSPDGTQVVFSSNRSGNFQLYTLSIGDPEDVVRSLPGVPPYTERNQRTPDWSPDGQWFACSMSWGSESEIFVADSSGPVNTRRVFQVTDTAGSPRAVSPSWGPNSVEVAYIKKIAGADSYREELWSLRLDIQGTISAFGDRKLNDLGVVGGMEPYEGSKGDPCWRRLAGLRIPDVELEGRVSYDFSTPLDVFGGTAPYTWTLLDILPSGLALSSDGLVSGTPTQAVKEHEFQVKAEDGSGLSGQKRLTVTIRPRNDLALLTIGRFLPPALEGVAYTANVVFIGGLSPYEVVIESATTGQSLPNNMNTAYNILGNQIIVAISSDESGFASGRYRLKVEVTDSFGDTVAGFFDLNVLSIDWLMADPLGDKLTVVVRGFPEDVGTEEFVEAVSIEAESIEALLPISGVSRIAAWTNITVDYPDDFSAWSSLFEPGVSTIEGRLKLRVDLDGQKNTVSIDFPLHRYMFRRDRGFRFGNFSSERIQFESFAHFFGFEETVFWLFGEPIPRLIPWAIWNAAPIGRGGNCTGMSVSAGNIADDLIRTHLEQDPNLPHAADRFDSLLIPNEILDDYIRERQYWVMSMEFIRDLAFFIGDHPGRYSNAVLSKVREWEPGEPPYLIAMFQEGKAHTVTAYAVEDLPDGRLAIRVYDSNKPFEYRETSDDSSAIYVEPRLDNSWSYKIGERTTDSGTIEDVWWHDDFIVAIRSDVLRGDPNLPGLLNVPELAAIGFTLGMLYSIGSADLVQATDGEGHQMLTDEGSVSINAENGLPYWIPIPIPAGESDSSARVYYIPMERSYALRLSGIASGDYDLSYMPLDGMLISLKVDTSEGSVDSVSIDPAALSTGMAASGSKQFSYRMAWGSEQEDKAFTASDMGADQTGAIRITAMADGNGVKVYNGGNATSYTLLVEYLRQDQKAQSLKSSRIRIGSGETQILTCTAWEDLRGNGIQMQRDEDSDGTWEETVTIHHQSGGEGLWVWILAALGVAGVMAGGFVFWRKRKAKPA